MVCFGFGFELRSSGIGYLPLPSRGPRGPSGLPPIEAAGAWHALARVRQCAGRIARSIPCSGCGPAARSLPGGLRAVAPSADSPAKLGRRAGQPPVAAGGGPRHLVTDPWVPGPVPHARWRRSPQSGTRGAIRGSVLLQLGVAAAVARCRGPATAIPS
jgi:hypothetical protein